MARIVRTGWGVLAAALGATVGLSTAAVAASPQSAAGLITAEGYRESIRTLSSDAFEASRRRWNGSRRSSARSG
jgi:hypothetical protein